MNDYLEISFLPQSTATAVESVWVQCNEKIWGPAIVALQVLNAVAQLFALRYAICMLEADPVTWMISWIVVSLCRWLGVINDIHVS